MTQSISVAHARCIDRVNKFSPVAALNSLETEREQSLNHPAVIRPAVYRNYCLNGLESPVLYGVDRLLLGPRLENLVEKLVEQMPAEALFLTVRWRPAFDIEQAGGEISNIMGVQIWPPARLATLLVVRKKLTHYLTESGSSMNYFNTLRYFHSDKTSALWREKVRGSSLSVPIISLQISVTVIPRGRMNSLINDYPDDTVFAPSRRADILFRLISHTNPPPAEFLTQSTVIHSL